MFEAGPHPAQGSALRDPEPWDAAIEATANAVILARMERLLECVGGDWYEALWGTESTYDPIWVARRCAGCTPLLADRCTTARYRSAGHHNTADHPTGEHPAEGMGAGGPVSPGQLCQYCVEPDLTEPSWLPPLDDRARPDESNADHEDDPGHRWTEQDLRSVLVRLWDYSAGDADHCAELIDRLAVMEELIGTLTALQAETALEFHERQVALQKAQGVRARDLGRGIGEQVGLARRLSPRAGSIQLAKAKTWAARLPESFRQLRVGQTSGPVLSALADATSHLADAAMPNLDAGLADHLSGWSATQARQAASHAAYEADPHGFVQRRAKAEQDRRVWTRPAPDCMAIISALLPVEQAVACFASLRAAAVTGAAEGDPRSQAQLMADTLVSRLTGQSTADAVNAEIRLTMTADSLLNAADTPAHLGGHGPIPAPLARIIATGDTTAHPARGSSSPPPPADPPTGDLCPACRRPEVDPLAGLNAAELRNARRWLRRIQVDPITGIATDMDARRRLFSGTVRTFLAIRDRYDRFPYSTATIRDFDHIDAHANGGPTAVDNGQGTSSNHNQLRRLPGWHTRRTGTRGETLITTPTGHTWHTAPPPQIGYPATTRPANSTARLTTTSSMAGVSRPVKVFC